MELMYVVMSCDCKITMLHTCSMRCPQVEHKWQNSCLENLATHVNETKLWQGLSQEVFQFHSSNGQFSYKPSHEIYCIVIGWEF